MKIKGTSLEEVMHTNIAVLSLESKIVGWSNARHTGCPSLVFIDSSARSLKKFGKKCGLDMW